LSIACIASLVVNILTYITMTFLKTQKKSQKIE